MTSSIKARIALVAAGTAIILAVFVPREAWPHDAIPSAAQPLGWTYDYSCCSTYDCKETKHGEITAIPEGYRIERTGEVIGYGDKRIKRSKDEFYHRCTPGGNPDAKKSICLYVPDRGL